MATCSRLSLAVSFGMSHNAEIINHRNYNAPINVKPEGGGGSGNPREFDCGVYPQGGDFDRTLCISSFNFYRVEECVKSALNDVNCYVNDMNNNVFVCKTSCYKQRLKFQ